LAGLVGAGRTEVCRALFGMDRILGGTIELGGKAYRPGNIHEAIRSGFGFVTEDRHFDGLILSDTVENNIICVGLKKLLRHGILRKKLSEATAQHFIEHLRIITPSMKQTVLNLSGGNQQKVVLAKWLFIQPRILLLDEATRGIDVGAKREIYILMSSLIKEGYSIVMVSSELLEVLQMSHRILVMREGEIVAEYNHNEATEEDVIKVASGLKTR
jgi:ABC-type sugar transport system ATPase subunit